MVYGQDWSAYARQSYALQFAGGIQSKQTRRHSRQYLAARRPGQVEISWPGWRAAGIRTWW